MSKQFDFKNCGVEQLTKKQAIDFYDSDVWKEWSNEEIVKFQLFQKRLAVDFGRFHEAIEDVLGRPVYTHEFGLNYDGIVLEYLGEKKPPSLKEVIQMIPEEKRIILTNP